MYYKIIEGKVRNSRTPIEGGFEKEGLKYECDCNRLVAVGTDDVRDMTDEELFQKCLPDIRSNFFQSADSYMGQGLSAAAYAYTCMKSLEGDVKAQANLQWAKDIWDEHDRRVDALNATNFMEITEEDLDFSSMGDKPWSVREY